jgi:hypothetical protein
MRDFADEWLCRAKSLSIYFSHRLIHSILVVFKPSG